VAIGADYRPVNRPVPYQCISSLDNFHQLFYVNNYVHCWEVFQRQCAWLQIKC